jgi:hypothetical protein
LGVPCPRHARICRANRERRADGAQRPELVPSRRRVGAGGDDRVFEEER